MSRAYFHLFVYLGVTSVHFRCCLVELFISPERSKLTKYSPETLGGFSRDVSGLFLTRNDRKKRQIFSYQNSTKSFKKIKTFLIFCNKFCIYLRINKV